MYSTYLLFKLATLQPLKINFVPHLRCDHELSIGFQPKKLWPELFGAGWHLASGAGACAPDLIGPRTTAIVLWLRILLLAGDLVEKVSLDLLQKEGDVVGGRLLAARGPRFLHLGLSTALSIAVLSVWGNGVAPSPPAGASPPHEQTWKTPKHSQQPQLLLCWQLYQAASESHLVRPELGNFQTWRIRLAPPFCQIFRRILGLLILEFLHLCGKCRSLQTASVEELSTPLPSFSASSGHQLLNRPVSSRTSNMSKETSMQAFQCLTKTGSTQGHCHGVAHTLANIIPSSVWMMKANAKQPLRRITVAFPVAISHKASLKPKHCACATVIQKNFKKWT